MRIWPSLSVLSAVVAAGAAVSACGATGGTAAIRPAAHAAPVQHVTARRAPAAADAASAAAASPAATSTAATSPAATSPAATSTATASPAATRPDSVRAAAAARPAPASAKLLPTPGNPAGRAYVPPAARAVDTSHPTHVIGHGTPASCTSAAVVRAVAAGGIITFNCGPNPVTIQMHATARVHNRSQRVVIDGGNKVILSGMGQRRILYMNTCDQSLVWTTDHCQNQATPRLTVQNLTFTDGRAPGHDPTNIGTGSGGAIYAQGGEFKVVNSRFTNNACYAHGPDLGGAAIRAFEEWNAKGAPPVYIVHSTFTGGRCSNGGALSSIGVSWTVLNSWLARNHAIGWGQNPTVPGTAGGGSGGAIYTDGDTYTLTVRGSVIRFNTAREGGGAIFYVSDDQSGHLRISGSTLHANPSGQFHNYPGTIFYIGKGAPIITDSRLDG
jgi:hypothetical protein